MHSPLSFFRAESSPRNFHRFSAPAHLRQAGVVAASCCQSTPGAQPIHKLAINLAPAFCRSACKEPRKHGRHRSGQVHPQCVGAPRRSLFPPLPGSLPQRKPRYSASIADIGQSGIPDTNRRDIPVNPHIPPNAAAHTAHFAIEEWDRTPDYVLPRFASRLICQSGGR